MPSPPIHSETEKWVHPSDRQTKVTRIEILCFALPRDKPSYPNIFFLLFISVFTEESRAGSQAYITDVPAVYLSAQC